jgi:PAS domain S-box-containing protein
LNVKTKHQIDTSVSETKGQEEEILARERYRVFVEDINDGFYETDLRGNLKFFNDAMCRIFGRTREEIQDTNYRQFMDEKNSRLAFESNNALFRNNFSSNEIVWDIIRKDGQVRTLEISAKLIYDKDGKKIGFRGIARDATEKYEAQKRALESEKETRKLYDISRSAEQRLMAFLRFLPEPVIVFNLDQTISYLNPAFANKFGWKLTELEGRTLSFIPKEYMVETRKAFARLQNITVLTGFESKRLTKDGRVLDVVIDAALFFDQNHAPAGQIVTIHDVTAEKRAARTNKTVFNIAKAIPHYRGLDGLLAFITHEVQSLMAVEGAMVILADEARQEFFFRAAAYEDTKAQKNYREARIPLNKGLASHVYHTGEAMIIHDYQNSEYYFEGIEEFQGFKTRAILEVPIWIEDEKIGVMSVVNKKEGRFDQDDLERLSAVANMVALPIENARINQELKRSYKNVKSLNRAKDRIIDHLSHELKTPVAVLSASMSLLSKKLDPHKNKTSKRIIARSQRNLQRILDMQYEIEDILKKPDYRTHNMLSVLLDASADELATLAEAEGLEADIEKILRKRIESLFGRKNLKVESVDLGKFVSKEIKRLKPLFKERHIDFSFKTASSSPVLIPTEILSKIVEGLVRNAIENTPDGQKVKVRVENDSKGPQLVVEDFGVGISEENQQLIFENYFTTTDTLQYSTGKPYEFNAGGRGFDLLRMKIFSERYNFSIAMDSTRCGFVPLDKDICPGGIETCPHCENGADCAASSGTTVTIKFKTA